MSNDSDPSAGKPGAVDITGALFGEGVKGAQADMIAYEMMVRLEPKASEAVAGLVDQGYTPDYLAASMRAVLRGTGKPIDEAHIANCMAVARHLMRERKREERE